MNPYIRFRAMRVMFVATLLICAAPVSIGTATADTFGSGLNTFDIEFVTIGNPGNAADTLAGQTAPLWPYGSVDYVYRIGKYEISRDLVAKANAAGSLGVTMAEMDFVIGGPRPEMPVTGVSWNGAARFVNWLNTSEGFPAAYQFSTQPGDVDYDANEDIVLWESGDAGFNSANPFRNDLARYVLPGVHEWHKAAYYDPIGVYYEYPTGSDSAPLAVASGTDAGSAVYDQSSATGPADVTLAGGLSPYGVMGLAGNVWEWEETSFADFTQLNDPTTSTSRGERGGEWRDSSALLLSSVRTHDPPSTGWNGLGFRVASIAIPEPSSLLLGALAAAGLLLRRKARMLRSRSTGLNLEFLEARFCLTTYTTVDLIPLAGHDLSVALGLNDNSMAVGYSSALGQNDNAAVVWSLDPLGDGSVSALPGVGGEQSAHASEINNQGMIAGQSRVPGGYSHAVVWTANSASYVAHDLGTLGGNDGSGAYSISEPDIHGNVWVVGVSGSRGVLWQVDSQGSVLSITDLAPSSTAAWANDVKVIGNSVLVAGSSSGQAVIWETDLSGTVVHSTELATTAYEAIEAGALNNDGDIAGWGREPGSLRNGFLYDNGGGVITDLGSLGNAGSKALGINDNDVVVGQYTNVKPYPFGQIEERAFVWESGTMHKLFDQVTDHKFWLLWNALDVNNNGEIVGHGAAGRRNNSQEHGFMARPEGPGGTTTVHVGDLEAASVPNGRGKWNATVTITVHASTEVPVQGATVTGSWSAGASGSSSCVTSASGHCDVTKNKVSNSSVTFTVDSIGMSGSNYSPVDNHDPDGDSSGTAIVALAPSAARAPTALPPGMNTVIASNVAKKDIDFRARTEKVAAFADLGGLRVDAVPTMELRVELTGHRHHLPLRGLDEILDGAGHGGLIGDGVLISIDEAVLQLFACDV